MLVTLLVGCEMPTERQPYSSDKALTKPALFSEKIDTQNGISFSPNGKELLVSLQKKDTFQNGRTATGIYKYTFADGYWSGPEEIALPGFFDAYHPVLSNDGTRLFFNSRFNPDSGLVYLPHDIWYSDKHESAWSAPRPVTAINSSSYESYPSIAANGNLYFNSNRPGGKGGMDIYMSEYRDGVYLAPKPLEVINSKHEENDLVVAPDERFIIFNRYVHEDQSIDLWLSLNQNGEWLEPVLIDLINENDVWELTPSLSPDGHYFFFEKEGQIWQVDLDVLLDDHATD